MSDGKGADHPFISGVVVAEGVEGGGMAEDVEVEVSKLWMMVEVVLEEVKEVMRGGVVFEVDVDEISELGLSS